MTSVLFYIQTSFIQVLQHLQSFVLHQSNPSFVPLQIGYSLSRLLIESPPRGVSFSKLCAPGVKSLSNFDSTLGLPQLPLIEEQTGEVIDLTYLLRSMLAPFLVLFIFKVVFSRWSPQGNLVEVELEPLEMGTLVDDVYVEIDFIHSSTFSEITQLTFVNVGEILPPQLTTISSTNIDDSCETSDEGETPSTRSKGNVLPAQLSTGQIPVNREHRSMFYSVGEQEPSMVNSSYAMMMANKSLLTLTNATSNQGVSNGSNYQVSQSIVGEEVNSLHNDAPFTSNSEQDRMLSNDSESVHSRPHCLLQSQLTGNIKIESVKLARESVPQPYKLKNQRQLPELNEPKITSIRRTPNSTAKAANFDLSMNTKASNSPIEEIIEPITPELAPDSHSNYSKATFDPVDERSTYFYNHNPDSVSFPLYPYFHHTPSQLWDTQPLLINSTALSTISSSFVSRHIYSRSSSFQRACNSGGITVKSFNFEMDLDGQTPCERLVNLGRLLLILRIGTDEEEGGVDKNEEAGWSYFVDEVRRKEEQLSNTRGSSDNSNEVAGDNAANVTIKRDWFNHHFEPPIYAEY